MNQTNAALLLSMRWHLSFVGRRDHKRVVMSHDHESRSPVTPSLIPNTQLHLPSEYVTHWQLTKRQIWRRCSIIISSTFLQRTQRLSWGRWWCGCMRSTINQVRITKLHQREIPEPWSSSVHHPSHQTLQMQESPFAVGSPKPEFASKWNWVTIRDGGIPSQRRISKVQDQKC